jgi:hypothetical protein
MNLRVQLNSCVPFLEVRAAGVELRDDLLRVVDAHLKM